MAGLRWRHYDPTTPVLGRLTVATSYDKGMTKTKRPRLMPVHPTLAAILDLVAEKLNELSRELAGSKEV